MVEYQSPEPATLAAPAVVGIDVGIVNFAVVLPTHRSGAEESLPEPDRRPFQQSVGGISDQLSRRIKYNAERMSTQLLLFWLPSPKSVVIGVEDRNLANLRFKSRQVNQLLTASQLGFLQARLFQKLHQRGYHIKVVNIAYSK